ncbi:MAG: DUF711 family protein, partial [Anaerolineae bacterium]|nr:DUF711 family protein [Anaerolineae bacterium]
MKIRSITYFLDPQWPLNEAALQQAGAFIAAARPAFEAAGYEVQTARLATVPFPQLVPSLQADEVIALAQAIEAAAAQHGYEYIALGPALPEHPASYALIPAVLAATENIFFTGVMASSQGGLSLPAVRA